MAIKVSLSSVFPFLIWDESIQKLKIYEQTDNNGLLKKNWDIGGGGGDTVI